MRPIRKTFVISLGGSLVVPEKIDSSYLRKFKKFIDGRIKKGERFIIVVGGGRTARNYRDAGAAVIKKMPTDDLDWLGIHATRLNAHLLRTIFRGAAEMRIITNPYDELKSSAQIIIAGGYRPGNSTDFVAVELAEKYGCTEVLNLSDVDSIYDKNPKKFKDAKPVSTIPWKKFQKLVGNKWDPGLHAPFDPIASKAAAKRGLRVLFLSGRNFKNLANALDNRKFKGTIIGD